MHHLHTEQVFNSSLVEQKVIVLRSLSIRLEEKKRGGGLEARATMHESQSTACVGVLFIH